MPKTKIKTHRGAAKRFNLTKNGKVKMNRAFRRHILNKKTSQEDIKACEGFPRRGEQAVQSC